MKQGSKRPRLASEQTGRLGGNGAGGRNNFIGARGSTLGQMTSGPAVQADFAEQRRLRFAPRLGDWAPRVKRASPRGMDG